ncbi:hypothetical protein EDC30_11091 [Paucimonas lemoignei]|uniref:Uncharacterized protein n=1 Tax=Paucimonas lemoignei TaxID=29443 RepID=A0A4R3HRM0_PAULE|nr:hypothetical protein [Paucimonas lemoignei]TCS35622.1 hypothetical protein EDC30_11091 [Paucimonas lemoignei]
MNVAFLFNSDDPSLGGYYGPPVMNLVLGAGVIQAANRSMRVSVGDILTYSAASQSRTPTYEYLKKLCNAVYQPIKFDRLNRDELSATFTTATVYCWLFQNITESIAQSLHDQLRGKDSYLGAMDVDFSLPLHLAFFRNKLIEAYRLRGTECAVFFDMGINEDPDIVVKEGFEEHGFKVSYEDQGARRTIFDNYDSLEHFKRVESFKSYFSKLPGLDADYASDLAHSLEELHPKLFDAFAAAARTLERAETEEDLAQAALSGRRLLERVADSLFPPQDKDWKGRKVGKPQYKNRLWAYVEQALSTNSAPDQAMLDRLGKEADRLIDLFNAGLHANPTREKVELAFRDLVIWLSSVINLNPAGARDPYIPYGDELESFLGSVFSDTGDEA